MLRGMQHPPNIYLTGIHPPKAYVLGKIWFGYPLQRKIFASVLDSVVGKSKLATKFCMKALYAAGKTIGDAALACLERRFSIGLEGTADYHNVLCRLVDK